MAISLIAKLIGASVPVVGVAVSVPLAIKYGFGGNTTTRTFKKSESNKDCKEVKLSTSAKDQNLKLWICKSSSSSDTPIFYFYDDKEKLRTQETIDTFDAKQVTSIDLKPNTSKTTKWLGNYDLTVHLSNGLRKWSRLKISDSETFKAKQMNIEDDEDVEEESETYDLSFLAKNKIVTLKPSQCKLDDFKTLTCENNVSFNLDNLIALF